MKNYWWLLEIIVVFALGYFYGHNESIFHLTKTHFKNYEGHWHEEVDPKTKWIYAVPGYCGEDVKCE